MKTKHSKVKVDYAIQYEEVDGTKYFLMTRDYSNTAKGVSPLTAKCPFCGKQHLHTGAIAGYRKVPCRKNVTCVAADESILNSVDGYILVNVNKAGM